MKKVLVIDDSHSILNAVSRLVKRLGHKVFVSDDASSGLEKALALEPDLILLDMMFPKREKPEGFDVTKQLREKGFNGLIVALTSLEAPLEQGYKKMGFDDWLSKGKTNLKAKIVEYLTN